MQTWRYKSFHKQPDSWSWDFRCKEIALEKQKKMCKHYLLTVQLHRLFIPTIVMYIFTNWEMNFRSLKVFYRKCVLRNFAKFTGKHLCQSLFFNKVAGNRPVPECFPMNFSKFLKAPFFLLNFSGGWFCVSSFDLAFFIMILSFYVGDSVAAKNWAD